MKSKYYLFLLLFSFSGAGYYAQAPVFPDADSVANYLTGTWKWERSCGGLLYSCYTPTSAGYYPQSLVFSRITGFQDSVAYSYYSNGTLTATGGSKITYTTSSFGVNWNLEAIMYTPPYPTKLSIMAAGTDSVWLADNCADCFERTYSRDKSVTVGISQAMAENSAITVYPNPVKENIELSLPKGLVAEQVFVYDALGKQLAIALDRDLRFDASGLSAGIYLISVQTQKGTYSAKFIRE